MLQNNIGEKPPNKLRSNENLQSKIKDGGSSDEHISNTSDRCKPINNLSRNSSENSLNPRDDILMKEERSVSAPIDGEKVQYEKDRLSSAAFFSTANIHQQWNTFHQLEKLKALLKSTPNYFEENENIEEKSNHKTQESYPSGGHVPDCENNENYKNPFALLAQSSGGSQDQKEGNVSINELVVKEYATEQEEMGKESEAHQSNSSKKHHIFQSRMKKVIIGEPLFKSLVGIQMLKPSTGGEFERVDMRTGKISASLEDLRNDFRSTIKTLALILMYLLISLPTYITAAIYRNCYCATPNGLQNCQELREYMYVFDIVSLIGHIVFPCTWLCFDKMYSDKLLKTFRIVRDAH